MFNFACEVKDKNYTFKTTSVMKLMRFLLRNSEVNGFIITVAADKDINFIDQIRPTAFLRLTHNIISEKKRELVFELPDDPERTREGFELEVECVIKHIVITCIFSHNELMMEKIDDKSCHFILEQDIAYDWNFELVIGKGENDDERLYSATAPMLMDRDWFISIVIFRYITGRPLVVASPDCINIQKPTPLLGQMY